MNRKKDTPYDTLPTGKKFLIQLILLKELPYAFVVLIGILGYSASQLWNEKVITIQLVDKQEKNIRDLQNFEEQHKISNLINNVSLCKLYQNEILSIYRYKISNLSLDYSLLDSLSLVFRYDTNFENLTFDSKFKLTKGSLRPSVDFVNKENCANKNQLEAKLKNLVAGGSLDLFIATNSSEAPYYYNNAASASGFRVISHDSIREILFKFRDNSGLVITSILSILFIYFLGYAYISAKYI